MGRKFVISDVHGGYRGVEQVFNNAKVDLKNDTVIFLGDSLDGWDEHDKIIDLFLKIKNFIFIMGNHDFIFYQWLKTGHHQFDWSHGGDAVIRAYERLNNKDYNIKKKEKSAGFSTTLKPTDIPKKHKKFYELARTHYLDEEGRLFLHAGFHRSYQIKDHFPELSRDTFAWDGHILGDAIRAHRNGSCLEYADKDVKRVFVGHTPVNNYGYEAPFVGMNLIGMDTGGCFKGKISLMDYEKLQTYQSTELYKLYPNQKGRN